MVEKSVRGGVGFEGEWRTGRGNSEVSYGLYEGSWREVSQGGKRT